jgi:plasmid replication initiation protein
MKKELNIIQHNSLTNARYEYSELQQDLLFFIISKLRKDDKTTLYQLNISELSKLTNKRYNATYLHKATADMGSRMFEMFSDDRYRQFWMFQRVDYLIGKGIMEIRLSEEILPFLFDLKENFTSYELAAALRLSSKHAKRIYPLCCQWRDKGETKKYDIKEFKKMIGLIDDKGHERMKQTKDFRESVLDIAVKQINEHTELRIDYSLHKVGKGFKFISFTVKAQALADTIPFDLVAPDTPAPDGLQAHQVENASRLLSQLSITVPATVKAILSSATHVAACNKYAHDMKTGKHTKTRSHAGLLLTILGFKKAENGPLFDAESKSRVL